MNFRKILGIIVVVCGLGMIGMSMYIMGQVEEGEQQISSAQKKVDVGTGITSLNPATKEIGKSLSGSVQKKIDEGSMEAAHYRQIAGWSKIGGIVLIALGGIIFLIPRRK
ncbi:MAG: hypothetical protein HYX48_05690 [Chlamydiales bacterium]|nr:hypothetical protein [Chlamydiales bacterium]